MAHSCSCPSCQPKPTLDELVQLPGDYLYKAFGPQGEEFVAAVRAAVTAHRPLAEGAVSVRSSRQNAYQCVTVRVYLEDVAQLNAIYAELHRLPGLKYLL